MLTEDQLQACDFLDEGGDVSVLKGYAGTGKTTTITEWARNKHKVLLTAPTNKATSVLSEMGGFECETVYRALGLRLYWNEHKQVILPSNSKDEPKFHKSNIVVIDECSMIDKVLLKHILDGQRMARNRVIFMGDPAQLPPIDEKYSGCFYFDSFELNEILRQHEDSPIPKLGKMLRDSLNVSGKLDFKEVEKFADDHTILIKDKVEFWDAMLNHFEIDEDVRFLAFKNKTVESAIKDIRQRLYGANAPEYMDGENVRTLSPIIDPITRQVIYSTDSLIRISSPRLDEHLGIVVWKYYVDGRLFMTPTSEHVYKYKEIESNIKSECVDKKRPWTDFHKFVESFTKIRAAQGMTVHKSQGSTFGTVYVDAGDILSTWDWQLAKKLMYVACSRPKYRLVIFR